MTNLKAVSSFNIDDSRSFLTEERLEAALVARRLDHVRHLVVCNRSGRFTAIFSAGQLSLAGIGLAYPAHAGFKVLA